VAAVRRDGGAVTVDAMNLASHSGSAADLTGGVEWQHAWSPSRPHEAELVRRLPALQRVLLTTDGTVTTALGTAMDEPIGVWLLNQEVRTLENDDAELRLGAGHEALIRAVLLHGARSGTPLLFGCSRIALDRLPRGARQALLTGDVPISLMLRSHRIETFRAPLSIGVRPASGMVAAALGPGLMCQRTYTIEAHRLPIMVVHEQFPAAGFAETG
jgi:chorismate-pyruvate lyase